VSRPLRVLHLVGSPTSAFHDDLSRLYAADCLAATADPDAYEVTVAHVGPDGTWRFPGVPVDAPPAALDHDALAAAAPMPIDAAVARLVDGRFDVAVPQLFCLEGMTHHRALLEVLGIPVVGNPPSAMALTADKAQARAVVAAGGVAVPEGEVVRRGERPSLEPPVVVKPVGADNSDGVTLVRDRAGYGPALADAWAHGDVALVERYVELGREVRCGTLERDGEIVCLPLEEYAVDPDRAPIRLPADKLARDDAAALHLVAKDPSRAWIVDPDDPVVPAVHDAAVLAHRALGCRQYGLFDVRIDPDGRPWFLEAGLYCSFARQSVLVVMAAAAGIPLRELFATAVDQAIARTRPRPARDGALR
jgi:D-alanine-D-alanine ligase